MIVRRRTVPWIAMKRGEVLALLKEERELFPAPHAVRIYRPTIAPGGKYVVEHEFESMEEMQSWFAQRRAEVPKDVMKDLDQRRASSTDTDTSVEIWELVE